MFFNSVKEINRLGNEINSLLSKGMRVFFNLIKEISRLRKETNRLLSKEMSNIYLKVTAEEKNWRSHNVDFLGLENLSPCQFWWASTHADIIEF